MNVLLLAKGRAATMCGLAIALLSAPAFAALYRGITGETHSNSQVLGRELGFGVIGCLLLWIIVRREALPLASIGLHTDRLGRSLVRALGLTVITLVATVAMYFLLRRLGIQLGDAGSHNFQPAAWVVTLVCARAGIVEEIFYRGYAIERLQKLTTKRWLATLVPLLLFAVSHYRQGPGGMLAVFVVGAVFTVFYLKFRDLVANISGHFLTDFVLNVILPL